MSDKCCDTCIYNDPVDYVTHCLSCNIEFSNWSSANDFSTLKAQRDELLAAAKKAVDPLIGNYEAEQVLRSAIANAEKDKSGC